MEKREWVVERWPPRPSHGMQTGKIGPGVRVTHCPSGLSETCDTFRSQHKNRDYCIELIRIVLERNNDH